MTGNDIITKRAKIVVGSAVFNVIDSSYLPLIVEDFRTEMLSIRQELRQDGKGNMITFTPITSLSDVVGIPDRFLPAACDYACERMFATDGDGAKHREASEMFRVKFLARARML